MKGDFYPKLALDGIRKNRRYYLPYLLTCAGMAAMHYIIAFLTESEVIRQMRGGASMQMILGLGVVVIEFFSTLFLLYTNSFLIRRRKKELGLYNILGMGKKNIGKILAWETLFAALISLGAGWIVKKLDKIG